MLTLQQIDFFNAFGDYRDAKNKLEEFLEDNADENGQVSEAVKKVFNEKSRELKKMGRELSAKFDKLGEDNAELTTKPILIDPHDAGKGWGGFNSMDRKNTAKNFGIAGEDYRGRFFDELRGGFTTAFNFLQEGQVEKGGYLVPREFHDEIVAQLKTENVFREIGRVITTKNDRELAIQTTAPTAAFVAEGATIPLSTEKFERKTLKAYKLAAGVNVSNELLSDAAYNVEQHLVQEFSKAVAAKEEDAFLNGTGTGEPLGLIPTLAADSDATITTAGASVAADDIINLCYSLARPYRKNACWLMSDSTLAAIRKLKDDTKNFLWQAGLSAAEPSTLLGYPVYTSGFMPTTASGKIPVLFGDFSKFIIGQRGEMIFKPLRELHALQDLTSFLLIERVDGVLSDKFAIRGLKVR